MINLVSSEIELKLQMQIRELLSGFCTIGFN